MKLALSALALLAALAAPQVSRAGSPDDGGPGWRKPRYDRPVYAPRRERTPDPQRVYAPRRGRTPDPHRGASLVPPMINTWNPFPRDPHGPGFAPRGAGAIGIVRPADGRVARPAMIGGARR